MNGGGPLASPLRALRHAPVVVDDLGVVPRLGAAARTGDAGGVPLDVVPLDVEERVRWTRAWLVACQGVLHDRGVIGTVPPWSVPLVVAELPTLKGDPERRRLAAALALLQSADLLSLAADARIATLRAGAFVEHRVGLELDWGAVCRAARHEPAPLLVARALADLVAPADAPTPVTLAELTERTGYAPKQVRTALRRLIEVGVLRTEQSAGMATQYCFGPVAIPGPQSATATAAPVAVPAPPAPFPTLTAASPAAAGRTVAVRLTLNGITLSLGPGLTPHVELGPDGVPHVSFDPGT